MVFSMTNRLLLMVITFALTSGVVAHAAQAPERPLAPITLPAASSLPMALQTAASHISETATAAIDPSAAIRGASLRDHVALEHLRQAAAAQLTGSRRPAFDQLISSDEAALTEIERTALATTRPAVSSSIAAMDAVVASAEAELNRQLSQATAVKSAAGASQPRVATTPGRQLAGNGKQIATTTGKTGTGASSGKSGSGDSSAKSGAGGSSGTSGSGDSSAKSGTWASSGTSGGDSSAKSHTGHSSGTSRRDSSGRSQGGDSSEHSHGE
jgi:hypothetical protein